MARRQSLRCCLVRGSRRVVSMPMLRRYLVLVGLAVSFVASCQPGPHEAGSPPRAAPISPAVNPEVPPAAPVEVVKPHASLAPLAWILGHWRRIDAAGQEHWIAAGRGLWGIGFTTRGSSTAFFEVMRIDADNKSGALRLTAMPGGARAVVFPATGSAEQSITFANPQHDAPTLIHYRLRADNHLVAELAGPGGAKMGPPFEFSPMSAPRAGAIEAADRAFASDVAARGIEGWIAGFAADGVLWRGDSFAIGHDSIRAAMSPMLSDPDARLEQEPATSALAPAGDVGLTVGRFRALRRGKEGQFEERARGTYVSVWRRQPDGSWKIAWGGASPE